MDIRYFPDTERVEALLSANEPVLVLIGFEGKTALVCEIVIPKRYKRHLT